MARKGREIAFLLTMLMLILHLPSASAQVLAPQLRGLFALSKAADDTHSNIFIVRPDGSQVGQLTALTGENTEPAWSTDGKMIAFTHQEGDETRIFIARLDNSAPYPLFDWQASAP